MTNHLKKKADGPDLQLLTSRPPAHLPYVLSGLVTTISQSPGDPVGIFTKNCIWVRASFIIVTVSATIVGLPSFFSVTEAPFWNLEPVIRNA